MTLLYDDYGGHDNGVSGLYGGAVEIFLDPGEYFVGDSTFTVRTLLGSCVSMVLWHQRLQYGAMSHFLLSNRKTSEAQEDANGQIHLDGKYGDEVLELMTMELKKLHVPLHECTAKIFGGGNMFPSANMSDKLNVGKRNGEAAKELLRGLGVRIVAEDLYGIGHREMIFNVRNGDVWIRHDRHVVMRST